MSSRGDAAWWLVLLTAIVTVELDVRPVGDVRATLRDPQVLGPALDRIRAAPFAAIDDGDAASIVSGVVLGRTEHVQPAIEAAFLDSGLWHLLAASGTNVALVAACCILLARWCRLGRAWGVSLACVAIPLYVLAVGGGASIVRAGIVGELALVAWLAGRLPDPRRLLLVAASVICWMWPGAHRGLGMQLSFACVLALMAGAVATTSWLRARGVPAWLAGTIAGTCLCGLATAPILVLRTGSAPVTGAVANLLAIPLAASILVVGLAGVLLHAAGLVVVAEPVLATAGLAAKLLARIAERAAALPAAQVEDRTLLVGVPVLVAAGFAARARVASVRGRARLRVLVVAGVAAVVGWSVAASLAPRVGFELPGAPSRAGPRPPGVLRVAVLDVGQGDATLLAADTGAVLVDTGPPDGDVVRRVRSAGVSSLDGIVLTHDSLDHRGGFDAALAAFDPAWVAMPAHAPGPWQRIRSMSPRVIELCDGSGLELGDVTIEVRNPPCDGRVRQRTSDVHNDGAMVLLVRDGALRLLLPADAEAPVLRTLALPPVQFLRVSHHGSSDPELDELLEELRPGVAAISVGAGNSYDHPRRDVLDALRVARVTTLRTDRDGTIVLDSDGRTLRHR